MTGPALDLIEWIFKKTSKNSLSVSEDFVNFKILVSFGNSERGRVLLRLANSFVRKLNTKAEVATMHLAQTSEIHQFNIKDYEQEIMSPIVDESKLLKQRITPIFKASNDINTDIFEEGNKGGYDLLLIGIGQSIYEGSFLGKVLGFTTSIMSPERLKNKLTGKEKLFDKSHFDERTREILVGSNIPVGILIEKKLTKIERVIIPFLTESDVQLVNYFQKLINNAEARITLVDINGYIQTNEELNERLKLISEYVPEHLEVLKEWEIEKKLINTYDLMMVSIESWESLVVEDEEWLNNAPSTLIIKP